MYNRKRIGLYLQSYSTFPALVIYIQNIIRTLNTAPDDVKPHLVILHVPGAPVNEVKSFGYPHISFYELKKTKNSLSLRAANKISRKITGKNILSGADSNFPNDLDCIFPYDMRRESEYVKHKIVWKPDFQEMHLPVYFTVNELTYDKEWLQQVASQNFDLVLSSEDAKRDYERAYPDHRNKIHLWKFTSFLPSIDHIDVTALNVKFGINRPYFLVANQFWPHKNHLNVLKALKECIKHNPSIKIVFTGKQKSLRDPELFEKLKYYIDLNKIGDHVIFTGFIEREEQLTLMKNALAVIQPSLFEGWSTVIEDCKALNQFVIASQLSVNKEQIKENVTFFDPYDYKDLSEKILDFFNREKKIIKINYEAEIVKFRENILATFNNY